MQEFTIVKTAAEAALEANLFDEEKWKSVGYDRRLSSIGVVGSTNIADCGIEIWAGEVRKGTFYNTTAGANLTPSKEDMQFPDILIPKNQEISARVIDAAAANALVIVVQFKSVRKRARTFTRSSRIRNPTAYNAAVARNQRYGR